MSVETYIPTVWAAGLLTGLHKHLVFAQPGVVNTEYEGEITKQGDRVKINFIGEVSVFDVERGEDIPDPEELDTNATYLDIDQAKGFNFAVDDVDKVQAKGGDIIENAMGQASYGVRDKIDASIASLYSDAAAANLIGDDTTPIVPTADTAYDYLVDLSVKLDEANVPSDQRWAVVPPWYHGYLLKDKRFVGVGSARSDETLRNGQVGEAAGFMILKSNNIRHTSGTKYKIMAGHPLAISYADQIVQVKAFSPEKRFADAVKGLHVFGRKVVRSNALAVLTANKS